MKLKEIRVSQNITQKKLAHDLQYNTSLISMWEHGTREPSNETLIKLAEYFNVTLDELMGRECNSKKINTKFRDYRIKNNLTQIEVAKILGFQQTLISKWEKNEREPNLDTLCKMADLYNTSIDNLLGRESNFTVSSSRVILLDYVKNLSECQCYTLFCMLKSLEGKLSNEN